MTGGFNIAMWGIALFGGLLAILTTGLVPNRDLFSQDGVLVRDQGEVRSITRYGSWW